MKTVASILLLACALVLASCATTRGSLFKQVLGSSPPSSGSSSVEVQPSSTKPEQTGLEVQTVPTDAQVYINDSFIGDTPVIYKNFSAGTYKVTISKRGYYDNVQWINLDPTAYTLVQADLAPKVGYLSVTTSPANAEVTIDGSPMQSRTQTVVVGTHTVRARAFGYDDRTETVDVYQNETVDVHLSLPEASFQVSNLTASRTVLNPLNPGLLGAVSLNFEVSTYGQGSLRVTDSSGTSVYQHSLPQFVGRKQSVYWNGRGSDGTLLPDGSYRLTISGRGRGTSASSSQSVSVEINRGAFIGLRSLLSGVSGLLYAGTPGVLPKSSYSVSSLLLAHAEAAGSMVPIQVALRAVPATGIEIDGQASAMLKSTNTVPFSVGAAGKFSLLRPSARDGLSAALTVKATYLSLTASDTLTNFTGLSVGAPIEYRFGPFGIVFMPEVIAAPYPATYTAAPATITPSFWGYARGGLFLDFGSLVTGVSAALRSEPFSRGIGLAQVPLAAGWEIHWLIPGTHLVLSGVAAAEYSPDPSIGFYGMGGAGIGFVN